MYCSVKYLWTTYLFPSGIHLFSPLQLLAYLFFSRYLLIYCPCVYIVRVSFSIISGAPSVGILLLKSEVFVCHSICPFQYLFTHLMWITWRIQHVNVRKCWTCDCVKHTQSLCRVFKKYPQYRNELFDHLLPGPSCTPRLISCLWYLVIFFVLRASFIICTLL
jgi:hypothetical protein